MSSLFEEFGFDFGEVINEEAEEKKAPKKEAKKVPEKKTILIEG